jgi:hypothetical protein
LEEPAEVIPELPPQLTTKRVAEDKRRIGRAFRIAGKMASPTKISILT